MAAMEFCNTQASTSWRRASHYSELTSFRMSNFFLFFAKLGIFRVTFLILEAAPCFRRTGGAGEQSQA